MRPAPLSCHSSRSTPRTALDATNFGVNGPDGIHNLGYSLSAQLDIPVWDWLATERKVKQAKLREGAARIALTAAQRRSLANITEFYAEAERRRPAARLTEPKRRHGAAES